MRGSGPAGAMELVADRLMRTVDGQQLMPHISFRLAPGRIIFFQGPSGSGKTTALRLLGSLDSPDPTSWLPVTLGGKTPDDVSIPVWRSRVVLVPQTRLSLTGTPLELFRVVLKFAVRSLNPRLPSEEEFVDTCASFGLTIEHCEREWKLLSGGEAQRATIAVAFTLCPEVLLLDEISSALDRESTSKVERAVAELCRKGTSVCWISHDVHQAERMAELLPNRTCVLDFEKTS